MSQLSTDDVRHIAKLARLRLTKDEEERFAPELSSVIGYIEMLSEVNTDNVEIADQVTGLSSVYRPDEIRSAPLATPDELLETSPLPIVDHQIQTPSAHGAS